MRENADIKIIGANVILIPYETKHVQKYHKWMCDPELLKLTASEPLTLDQEYDMQETWRHDEDKCTFLVLEKEIYERTTDEIGALIGDTNLFLNQDYFLSDFDNECAQQDLNNETIIAEAEIMIAEPEARGKGLGNEAILLMLKYGQSELGVQEFVSKIGYENIASQNLFTKLKFEEQSRSDVFQEVAFKRTVDENWIEWLNQEIKTYKIENYSR
ncbi:N-acetyltransferase 9-like protein [Contarinia nasturtii]|uniref:N-acetyltransferase 9-like protein n=1 Tax=Contarinia nasturtii TaxID=265458 RepID=UPI0012D445CF|nr:N-acetyltransferase 9-like protein [Contarinia nasturtii]